MPRTTPRGGTRCPSEEQRKVIAEHPDWIGKRDGVPTPARSEANKRLLDRELVDAQRAVDEMTDLAGVHPVPAARAPARRRSGLSTTGWSPTATPGWTRRGP